MTTETPAGTIETNVRTPRDADVRLYPTTDSFPEVPGNRATLNTSKLTVVFADLLVISLAFVFGTWLNTVINPLDPTPSREYLGLFLLSLPIWPAIFTQQLLYRVRFLGRRVDEISRLVRAIVFGVLATAAISTLVKVSIGRSWLIIVATVLLVSLVAERLVAG